MLMKQPMCLRPFMRGIRLLVICILCGFGTASLAAPTPVEALPAPMQAAFARLSPSSQQTARDQLAKMGYFDAAHSKLDHTGRFIIVEDGITVIPAYAVLNASPAQPISLATLSDTQVIRYSPEGVPLLHSLSGSPNVLYLNFLGGHIAGRAWNDFYGLPPFDALPYNPDGLNGFSDAERSSMAAIWRRVAEDFSPWQIDVTTEKPVNATSTTVTLMITKRTSATGSLLPSPSAGGVAYLDTFGYFDSEYYSPGFVYWDNLAGGREDVIAESASHEFAHAFGLSHDGTVHGSSYYSGAGSGAISWGPIMGASYFRAVTKFSNGDYPDANNQEDDIGMITSSVPLRVDTVGNTLQTAKVLTKANGTFAYTDILEASDDVDVFAISGVSALTVNVRPYSSVTWTPGNNVDLALELLDASGTRVAYSSPDDSSAASLTAANLRAGTYYLRVTAVGNPITPYSVYGSMGQYDISGTFINLPTSVAIYEASMSTFPSGGWSVTAAGQWAYGTPTSQNDPHGFPVIGNVIVGTGLYTEPITQSQQLISAPFSTQGFSSVTVSFDRFLGVMSDDVVTLHACTPTACALIYTNLGTIKDAAWRRVVYALPPSVLSQSNVRLRFGLGPTRVGANGAATTSFGWNIKGLQIVGVP